jgi:hypothetical protein
MFVMGIEPHRPTDEIEHHLKRGELQHAIAIAKDFRHERGRPIPIAVALLYLPVVLTQRTEDYDRSACKWLARWLTETRQITADLAEALVELKQEPTAIAHVKTAARVR